MGMNILPINQQAHRFQGCSNCLAASICETMKKSQGKQSVGLKVHQRHYVIDRKDIMLRGGDKRGSIFAICSGSFKSVNHLTGEGKVTDLHLPGDMLGLESYMGNTPAKYDLVANEKATVSEFILPNTEDIDSTVFLKELIAISGGHLLRFQQRHEAMGCKKNTLQLVASFIYSLAQSHSMKNIVISEFRLPLTRSEIAEYLGLAPETISRQFVHLEKMKLIKTNGQRITILDHNGLQDISGADTYSADDDFNEAKCA